MKEVAVVHSFSVHGYLSVENVVNVDRREYRGVDRDPWAPIYRDFWPGTLPANIATLFARISSVEWRGMWWPYADELRDARTLHEYARQCGRDVSLVAVRSDYLGATLERPTQRVEGIHLGFDVISPGEWSLLGEMHHSGDDVAAFMNEWTNDHGLLVDPGRTSDVVRIYRELSRHGLVEEISSDARLPPEPVDVIEIPRR